jgi:hypothetical protein
LQKSRKMHKQRAGQAQYRGRHCSQNERARKERWLKRVVLTDYPQTRPVRSHASCHRGSGRRSALKVTTSIGYARAATGDARRSRAAWRREEPMIWGWVEALAARAYRYDVVLAAARRLSVSLDLGRLPGGRRGALGLRT